MWEKLISYFNGRKFSPVDLHREGMRLFYTADGQAVSLVWMISDSAVHELSEEQITRYATTIRGNFLQNGYTFVQLQLLFLTSDVDAAKKLGNGQMFWIVDEAYGRLVIFENQPEEYLGLRKMIETNLRFGGDSRNSEGLQQSADTHTEKEDRKLEKEKEKILQRNNRAAWFRKLRDASFVTYALILVNLLVFLYQDLISGDPFFMFKGAISWESVVTEGEWWRIFTCLFLHASVDHIMGNMIGLFAGGDFVENRLGHVRFAILYFVSGIGSSLASIGYHHWFGTDAVSVGASGAIYGIFGALVMIILMNPETRTKANFSRMAIFVIFLFYNVFLDPESGIDYSGHIGGFLVGSLVCMLLVTLRTRSKRRR